MEAAELADGVDVGCERDEVRIDSRVFGLSSYKDEVAFT